MKLPRLFALLACTVLLGACSGGDAPPAPSVTSTANATEQTAPAADAPAAEPAPPPATPPVATPAPTPTAAVATPPPETAAANAAPSAASDAFNYEVQCPAGATAAEQCKVDKDTYIGWRTFASQCQVCHGGSALGSTFAPNLLERFHQRVDHARFVAVVTHGFRGQVGAMPAWKGNPNVMPHVDQMYRYLKARADAALPPGRPERTP